MMEIKNKTILITGGAGFIGSNLAEKLAGENKVIVLDNLTTGSKENISDLNVDFRQGEAKDVLQIVPEKTDFILHLGMASSTTLYLENKFLVASQIEGSVQVFEKAVKDRAKVVIASSSSIYNHGKYPSTEDQPIKVTDFYTECRLCIERLAELYCELYDMKATVVRMFSVYGGKRELNKGPFVNMIIKFIRQIKQGTSPVSYDIRPNEVERDFIYIDDIVKGWFLAMSYDKNKFDIFNLGSGEKYSFAKLVDEINIAMEANAILEYEKNPLPNLVFQNWADTKKAKNILGFEADFSLGKGLEMTCQFLNQK